MEKHQSAVKNICYQWTSHFPENIEKQGLDIAHPISPKLKSVLSGRDCLSFFEAGPQRREGLVGAKIGILLGTALVAGDRG